MITPLWIWERNSLVMRGRIQGVVAICIFLLSVCNPQISTLKSREQKKRITIGSLLENMIGLKISLSCSPSKELFYSFRRKRKTKSVRVSRQIWIANRSGASCPCSWSSVLFANIYCHLLTDEKAIYWQYWRKQTGCRQMYISARMQLPLVTIATKIVHVH